MVSPDAGDIRHDRVHPRQGLNDRPELAENVDEISGKN